MTAIRGAVPFTQLGLSKLVGKQGERLTVQDTKVRGLRAELRTGGSVTFHVIKRLPNSGPLVKVTIGLFPAIGVEQARRQAQKLIAKIADGHDVAEVKRGKRAEPTFAELWAAWLTFAKQHKKSWTGDQNQYDLHLQHWAGRRLSAISKADVATLHSRLGESSGKYAANRVLSLVHAMFAHANRRDFYSGMNPAHGIAKFKEKSRDRFLHPSELPKFFEALNAEPNETARDFFRLALLTGGRRANVQAMAWEDINLEAAVWKIPETKSGEAVAVHLPAEAVELLKARQKATGGSPWVFPSHGAKGHIVEPKAAWKRILTTAGLRDLRIHDLRRTLGSFQAAAGASLAVIGKSLGHKAGSPATAVYARLDLDPVRTSVDLAVGAMLAAGKAVDNGQS